MKLEINPLDGHVFDIYSQFSCAKIKLYYLKVPSTKHGSLYFCFNCCMFEFHY
jgi:hypothetical protein